MGIFGGLALLLAGIGIYGVLSSTVHQRTPEIGLRMALGAGRENVLRMVMGYGLKLVLVGMAIGLCGRLNRHTRAGEFAVWSKPCQSSDLPDGVRGVDLVAIAACYLPARAAIKVDPVRALRAQ